MRPKVRCRALFEEASAGEEIIIAKAGRQMVKLVPVTAKANRRVGGQWKGKVWMADDFDAPLPDDLLDLFEGKGVKV